VFEQAIDLPSYAAGMNREQGANSYVEQNSLLSEGNMKIIQFHIINKYHIIEKLQKFNYNQHLKMKN
jgi:hypothetical protein